MPMIVKGTPLMKIVSPTGLISWPTFSGAPQSSSRVAVPMTHTFRAISSSNSLNIRPYSITCSFISSAAGPMQFQGRKVFPLADKVAGMRISGEKSVTNGALCLSASTSLMVMPTAWSERCRCSTGRPWGVILTFSRPPMATSASLAPFSIPATRADIATRLETPRIMPNIVRRDRNLCDQISRMPARMDMPSCAHEWRRASGEAANGPALMVGQPPQPRLTRSAGPCRPGSDRF